MATAGDACPMANQASELERLCRQWWWVDEEMRGRWRTQH
jgi:hypothetical protein